eukprot:3859846-Amphidinium_carterae.1
MLNIDVSYVPAMGCITAMIVYMCCSFVCSYCSTKQGPLFLVIRVGATKKYATTNHRAANVAMAVVFV